MSPRYKHAQVAIRGIGSCVPQHRVSNVELLERISNFDSEAARASFIKRQDNENNIDYTRLDEPALFDLWVQQVCGIKERPYITKGEFEERLACEHMAAIAGERALEHAGLAKEAIEHVIFSTYSSNRVMPTPAATLVRMLQFDQGAGGVSAVTFNGACSGFLDAFIDGYIKIAAGYFKHVLIVASENMSDKMDFTEPTSCIIFGDGAGAVVLSGVTAEDAKADDRSILGFASAIDYSEQINMFRGGTIYFNKGPYVQRNAVQAMYAIGKKALLHSDLDFKDIHYIIPHQANARITSALAGKITAEAPCQVLSTIETTGNLSSAAVPVALDMLVQGKLAATPYLRGKRGLFVSVGGGYTFSGVTTLL
ncbi:3-oxoacyl-[acyl-carrier-protein] synthase 3 [Spirochaetota bacterium]|nr:3-oxoacyl-[acyl-carrier-protein] synthase 3 [Spirochaetota bacterium]